MQNVVWVTFACTIVFMLFTGTLIAVLAAVAGELNAVWVVGLFLLGGVTPLFVILFDAESCAAANRSTRTGTIAAALFVAVAVPTALVVCFIASGDPGPWDYLSFAAVLAYSLTLTGTVLIPGLRGACGANIGQRSPPAPALFPKPPAAQYNTVANFFAVFAMVGASAYCVIQKLWAPSPLACGVIVGVFVLVMMFVGVAVFCSSWCHLPGAIRRVPAADQVVTAAAAAAAAEAAAATRPHGAVARSAIGGWIERELRNGKIPHTEAIAVRVATATADESGGGGGSSARDQEQARQDHGGRGAGSGRHQLKATVHVTKHGSSFLFRVTQMAQPLQAFFAHKTLFL